MYYRFFVSIFFTGLSYEMDKVNGSCKIGAIQNSFDVHNGSVPEMKSPAQMFFVDNSTSDVYYTGKVQYPSSRMLGWDRKTPLASFGLLSDGRRFPRGRDISITFSHK